MPEMTTTERDLALSRDQVQALRTANAVCFDHNRNGGDSGQVRAIRRGKAPWFRDDEVQAPALSTVTVHGDGLDGDTRGGRGARCFAMIYSSQFCEEWQTIVGLLRAGDVLELRWVGADNNGYLGRARVTERDPGCHDAGLGEPLFLDRLYVHVRRAGKRRYSFYLVDSVCPNNSARMIKPNG